jgi:hypothetical protein
VASKYVQDHWESLKLEIPIEELNVLAKDLLTMGKPVYDVGIAMVSRAYGRPIEIWQRVPNEDGIESHASKGIAENSILLWYNGLRIDGPEGRGNHYDALIVVDHDLFSKRAEKCPRLCRRKEVEEKLVENPSHKEGTQRTRGSDDDRQEAQINVLTESIGKTSETGGLNNSFECDGFFFF